MTSREKLEQLLVGYTSGAPGAGAGGLELAVRTVLRMPFIGATLREALAMDPAELDRMLEHGARQLLQLRSDDAAELVTVSVCAEDAPPLPLPGG